MIGIGGGFGGVICMLFGFFMFGGRSVDERVFKILVEIIGGFYCVVEDVEVLKVVY